MTAENSVPQGKQIMLVDDDRLVLTTLAGGLVRAGYQVIAAESAEEAETFLASAIRPDLAILDVRMPGNGGLHLAQRLHELDHIPFMMLSAYSDAAFVARATQLGALGYCVKPVDVAHLAPAIESAMARANEIQGLRETRKQLQNALDGERNISVATGVLMMEYRLKRHVAFALLRDTARKKRRKLAEFACEVVAARETLNIHSSVEHGMGKDLVVNSLDKLGAGL